MLAHSAPLFWFSPAVAPPEQLADPPVTSAVPPPVAMATERSLPAADARAVLFAPRASAYAELWSLAAAPLVAFAPVAREVAMLWSDAAAALRAPAPVAPDDAREVPAAAATLCAPAPRAEAEEVEFAAAALDAPDSEPNALDVLRLRSAADDVVTVSDPPRDRASLVPEAAALAAAGNA